MKTENAKLSEILESRNLHGLSELIFNAKSNVKRDNMMGETIIELIAENENSKVYKLAKKCEVSNSNPSKSDTEILFKEIADNIEYYRDALNNYSEICKDDALDVLRDIYPNKSDIELRLLIA